MVIADAAIPRVGNTTVTGTVDRPELWPALEVLGLTLENLHFVEIAVNLEAKLRSIGVCVGPLSHLREEHSHCRGVPGICALNIPASCLLAGVLDKALGVLNVGYAQRLAPILLRTGHWVLNATASSSTRWRSGWCAPWRLLVVCCTVGLHMPACKHAVLEDVAVADLMPVELFRRLGHVAGVFENDLCKSPPLLIINQSELCDPAEHSEHHPNVLLLPILGSAANLHERRLHCLQL